MREGWFCYTITSRRDDKLVYSGATNNVCRRMRQHNGLVASKATYSKRLGHNNAKLALLIGPLPKKTALSVERRLKNYIFSGGGLAGRCRSIVRLLSLPEYVSRSAKLSADELKRVPVQTALSREEFCAVASVDDTWINENTITFNVDFEK